MGTWAEDSFGNDTACDWAYSLEKQTDLAFIEKTIEKVLNTEFDSCDAEEAIAAAEVVARLQGNWGERNAYTEPADMWIEKIKIKPNKTLVKKVHKAIDRILSEPSDLLELWKESDNFEKWKKSVTNLKLSVTNLKLRVHV